MQTIRELRKARGWAQADLALRLRVAQSTIYKWESGKAQPQLRQFKELAELFGVGMDEIEIPGPARDGRSPRTSRSLSGT